MSNKLTITLTRSVISSKKKHKATVAALGLRRINQTVILNDTPSVRGMVAKVSHLVKVEEGVVEETPPTMQQPPAPPEVTEAADETQEA